MNHWGWYWNIKHKYRPRRRLCSNMGLGEIDSFAMYNRYFQVEAVRRSASKKALEIPDLEFNAYLQDDDSLRVEHAKGSYIIPVEKKACNFGGFTHFFRCPLCKKAHAQALLLRGAISVP